MDFGVDAGTNNVSIFNLNSVNTFYVETYHNSVSCNT